MTPLEEIESALAEPFDLDAALAAETHAPAWTPEHPQPEWVQPRTFVRKKRHKKEWYDRAPNHCKCYGYASTGQGRVAKRPEVATDLCTCQVKLAFLRCYPHPIDAHVLRLLFLFGVLEDPRTPATAFAPATAADMEHIEWVVEWNRDAWLEEMQATRLPTVEEHKAVCRYIGMTDAQFEYWHGETAKRRELAKHHTH